MRLKSASLVSVLLLVLLAGLGAPTAVHGQVSKPEILDCQVFDGCALRIRHRLFGTEIVRGTQDTPIAEIGFRTPPLEELFARSQGAGSSDLPPSANPGS